MIKRVFIIKLIMISLLPGAVFAFDNLSPYFGGMIHKRQVKFQQGYGESMLKSNPGEISGFVGVKFNDYVAVEAGYFSSVNSNKKVATLDDGAFEFGINDPTPLTSEEYATRVKVRGTFFNVIGYYNIEDYNVSLLGIAGIANTRLNVDLDLLKVDGSPATDLEKRQNAFKGHANKVNARLGIGVQSEVYDNLSIRATALWENTSNLTITGNTELSSDPYSIKLKNSIKYGVGAVYSF